MLTGRYLSLLCQIRCRLWHHPRDNDFTEIKSLENRCYVISAAIAILIRNASTLKQPTKTRHPVIVIGVGRTCWDLSRDVDKELCSVAIRRRSMSVCVCWESSHPQTDAIDMVLLLYYYVIVAYNRYTYASNLPTSVSRLLSI